MTQLLSLAGGYRFIPGEFKYSSAVIAEPGYAIERVRLTQPLPLAEGFAFMEAYLGRLGRPMLALCACELRSPAAMTEEQFKAFNLAYVIPLKTWGLTQGELNPVARCNLIPQYNPPTEPSLYAFCYTVPDGLERRVADFVTSGAAECPDRPNYRDNIVRLGDTSPDALLEKLSFALGDLEDRLRIMGVTWADVRNMNLYSRHDLHHALEALIAPRGLLTSDLGLHAVSPPVVDIEVEIDAKRISRHLLLDGRFD
ncbi:hypothetical protein [Pseudomonas sp. GD03944]|uniref:2-amino-5-chloromuconate deaminase CnbZ n=1 Tax=Pseudomonas sp. GD03944 TaxID=2975409 RepID=UPI0024472C6C|nr:hypothetical protein [Pseudomonas sp. GD03944]MDH1264274.1 hypothetical protein [Pseudomonas sp. GD03944]